MTPYVPQPTLGCRHRERATLADDNHEGVQRRRPRARGTWWQSTAIRA
jgi:hypothetical protein